MASNMDSSVSRKRVLQSPTPLASSKTLRAGDLSDSDEDSDMSFVDDETELEAGKFELVRSQRHKLRGSGEAPHRRHPAFKAPPKDRDTPDSLTVLYRPTDTETTFVKLTNTQIGAAVKALGKPVNAWRRIRKGGIAVDYSPDFDKDSALAIEVIGEISVEGKSPTTSSGRKGTVRIPDTDMAKVGASYVAENSNPPIHSMRRLGTTSVYVFHFVESTLPEKIVIDDTFLTVSPYFIGPVRCFNCHLFNHLAGDCRNKKVCRTCGETAPHTCSNVEKCKNCGQAHNAATKTCSHRIFHLKVAKTQAFENLSRAQAWAKVVARDYRKERKSGTKRSPSSSQPSKQEIRKATTSKTSPSQPIRPKHTSSATSQPTETQPSRSKPQSYAEAASKNSPHGSRTNPKRPASQSLTKAQSTQEHASAPRETRKPIVTGVQLDRLLDTLNNTLALLPTLPGSDLLVAATKLTLQISNLLAQATSTANHGE